MVGAPVSPRAPPATTTTPDSNLLPERGRGGTSFSTASAMTPARSGRGAPRGIPISTTSTRPACPFPGSTYRPTFGPWNVAVASALTASPSTSPVDAFTPEGTSQATTGAPASLIALIAPATGSRGSPSKPVPSIASTIAPDRSRCSGANSRGGSPGRRSRFARASPFVCDRSPTASTSTSRPSSRRSRATTRPSPPLFPLPHTTRTGPRPATEAVARASPAPARSIRSSPGIPRSSIAQASAERISAASYSGWSQSGRLIAPRVRCMCMSDSSSVFRAAERDYLAGGRQLGRIATVGSDGTPHVMPVAWIYNAARDTIDIRWQRARANEEVSGRGPDGASRDRHRRSRKHRPLAPAWDRGARTRRGDFAADTDDPNPPRADHQLGAGTAAQRAHGGRLGATRP